MLLLAVGGAIAGIIAFAAVDDGSGGYLIEVPYATSYSLVIPGFILLHAHKTSSTASLYPPAPIQLPNPQTILNQHTLHFFPPHQPLRPTLLKHLHQP